MKKNILFFIFTTLCLASVDIDREAAIIGMNANSIVQDIKAYYASTKKLASRCELMSNAGSIALKQEDNGCEIGSEDKNIACIKIKFMNSKDPYIEVLKINEDNSFCKSVYENEYFKRSFSYGFGKIKVD